jgi:hypothetical protein
MVHALCKNLSDGERKVYIAANMLDRKRVWLTYEFIQGEVIPTAILINRIWQCDQEHTLGADYAAIPRWEGIDIDENRRIMAVRFFSEGDGPTDWGSGERFAVVNPQRLWDYGG